MQFVPVQTSSSSLRFGVSLRSHAGTLAVTAALAVGCGSGGQGIVDRGQQVAERGRTAVSSHVDQFRKCLDNVEKVPQEDCLGVDITEISQQKFDELKEKIKTFPAEQVEAFTNPEKMRSLPGKANNYFKEKQACVTISDSFANSLIDSANDLDLDPLSTLFLLGLNSFVDRKDQIPVIKAAIALAAPCSSDELATIITNPGETIQALSAEDIKRVGSWLTDGARSLLNSPL